MPAASKESVSHLFKDEDREIHTGKEEGERKTTRVKTREMYLRCSADTWLCHFILSGFSLLTTLHRKMVYITEGSRRNIDFRLNTLRPEGHKGISV